MGAVHDLQQVTLCRRPAVACCERLLLIRCVVVWNLVSRFVTVTRRGQQYKAMGPVFDMFNHDPASSTMHGFKDASDCLHIFTPQAWSAGQELFINYGPLSNTHLSMFYGFAVPNNQYDHVDLWATMSPETPSYELKQAVLLANGVMHDQQPFKLYADRPPTDIIQALRVQASDPRHVTNAEGVCGSPVACCATARRFHRVGEDAICVQRPAVVSSGEWRYNNADWS